MENGLVGTQNLSDSDSKEKISFLWPVDCHFVDLVLSAKT
jgi:hypothetical protein